MDKLKSYIDLKNLAKTSAVYGIGSILLKGLTFLLLPLYTHYLSTEDYGIIAITTSVLTVLTIVFSLELRGAINFFYFKAHNEEQRQQFIGSIWFAMLLISLSFTILSDIFGSKVFAFLYHEIPYQPYFRIAIWTALFLVFAQTPLVLFQAREKPVSYIKLTLVSTLLTLGLVIYFVVYQKMGAFGYLLGYMISALIMIIPNFVIAFRQISLVFNLSVVKDALIYTLPLVPHSLSAWVLELSDRSILQKYVPLGEIGIYSLGYQFGSLLALLASAINSAWVPFLFRVYDQDPENASKRVSQLITYYVMFLSFILLGLMLFVQNIVEVMASPAYHEAYHVTYWVLVGQFFMALYYIPVNFLFLKKKTQWVPVVTITSGLIDIILNFILIPKYGYIGAAWAGLISKLAMLLIVYFIASKFVNLFYEYRRITLSVVWAAFLIFIGNQFSYFPLWVNLVIKSLVIIAYPAGLVMLGFLNNDEKVVLHRLFSSR